MAIRVLTGCLVLGMAFSGLQGQSQLLFPRLSFEDQEITGIAVVNPTSEAATVRFTAVGTDGQVIQAPGFSNPVERTVDPGTQLSEIASTLFAGRLDPARVAWVEATSPTEDLTGFFLALDTQISFFDGADLPRAGREIVFHDVRRRDGFSTELNLVNPSTNATAVNLALVTSGGRMTESLELAARGVARVTVAELFPGLESRQAQDASYILATAQESIAGFALIRSPGDALGLNAVVAPQTLNRLFFPQLAVLGSFVTTLTTLNDSDSNQLITITAHRPDGRLYDATDLDTNPVVVALGPGEILKADAQALFGFRGDATLEGWLEVESSSASVDGAISYSIPSIGSIAAVSTSGRGHHRALFSHIATTLGFFTGIAMLNPGTLAANVRVVALRPDGSVIGSYTTTILPGQRTSDLLTELIPAAAEQAGGLVWVSSDIPIYLTSIFGNATGVLANIPAQPAPPDYRPDATPSLLIMPGLAVLPPGGGQSFRVAEAVDTINWSVNGFPEGTEGFGRISEEGDYRAPLAVPDPLPAIVTAQSANQLAGASIDVISRTALVQGLGIVQSVAYLNGLQRLFAAELQLANGSSVAGAGAGQTAATSILDVTSGQPLEVLSLNDEVSAMLSFEDAEGREYLLLAGRSSGSIHRIDPLTQESAEVASGLDAPVAMTLDPLTGSLLVAQADAIVVIPASQLGGTGLTPPSTRPATARQGIDTGLGIRGIAVDGCTGEILVADEPSQSILGINRLTGQRRVLLRGFLNPGGLLGVYRTGVPCPFSFHVLSVASETGAISLSVPAAQSTIPWQEDTGARGLALVRRGSPLSAAEAIAVSTATGEVELAAVPGLYQPQPDNPSAGPDDQQCVLAVALPDANLEAAIRNSLFPPLQPLDPITCERAMGLTNLQADQRNIVSLEGLNGFPNLTRLLLFSNDISNLEPLSGLINLDNLQLFLNQVTDISPLRRLTRLENLLLSDNPLSNVDAVENMEQLRFLTLTRTQVEDLGPVAGLRRLERLFASDARISDISPLAGLTSLEQLLLDGNQIQDISAVEGLTQLDRLILADNLVTDISAIVANTGIGDGDTVSVFNNPLDGEDCANIQALIDRGVTLIHNVACP